MSASIGRSLRMPSLLLVCLAVVVIGGRVASEAGEDQPPAPSKQLPSIGCRNCPDPPTDERNTITPSPVTLNWTDGKVFSIKLVFTKKDEYDAFACQNVYVCYQPDKEKVVWEFDSKERIQGNEMAYMVRVKACKPRDGGYGTGTGRIIVTNDSYGPRAADLYRICTLLEKLEEKP